MRRAVRTLMLPMVLLLSVLPAMAVRRAVRVFDEHDGLSGSWVLAIGQDSEGYLWLATVSGVVRFDGSRFLTWSEHPPTYLSTRIATGPAGEVLVIDENGGILQVTGRTLAPVAGPDGTPLEDVRWADFGPDGSLWLARRADLLLRRDGAWRSVPLSGVGSLHRIAVAEDGGAWLTADSGLYRIAPDLSLAPVQRASGFMAVLELDDGSVAVMQEPAGEPERLLWRHDGRLETLFETDARPIDLARRGKTLFASFDRYLAIMEPGGPVSVVGPDDALPSGGPLLVDREGALWLGTFTGLLQFPEPETIWLGAGDGLPSSHTRFLERTRRGIAVTTWQGTGLIARAPEGWKVTSHPDRYVPNGCLDASGRTWGYQADWLRRTFTPLEGALDRTIPHAIAGFTSFSTCAPAPDGGLWMGSNLGLFRSSPDGGAPRRIGGTPRETDGSPGIRDVLEDSRGRLWISLGWTICHTQAERALAGETAAWGCQTPQGFRHTSHFVEASPGSIWVAARGGGVLRYTGGE